ncbi:MAG: Sec-independent protein translocase protein TatB [Campylobacterota bacterium]|nr:Sec-independent protein translocase protein TatB [Campylobacterota bacterium]
MFGMGFAEILIIGIIAILFLGPDKLPQAMVDIAKFLRSTKNVIANAKDSIDKELQVSEVKDSVQSYKDELMSGSNDLKELTSMDGINKEIADIKNSTKVDLNSNDAEQVSQTPATPEIVTFPKKEKISSESV